MEGTGPGISFFAFFVVLFLCFILDLIFFPVICSFQDVSWWKLKEIVRDLPQAKKGNSYRVKKRKRHDLPQI
ncbi:MAG: hypothetical protein ACOC6P_04590, partial [Candidatus Aminicenantaceae bacterium]